MPVFRTMRRVCVFTLLAYTVFYLFARWPGSKRLQAAYGPEALHLNLNPVSLNLRNAVDRALEEAISDILLAGKALHTNRSSRQDLKRILEIQETLFSAQWTRDPISAFNASDANENSYLDASSLYTKVCHLFSGKRILFVGPETTFFLHNLWLGSQDKHERQADVCFGRDYCTFHHICRDYNHSGSSPSSSLRSGDAPPTPIQMVGRKKKMPSKNTLRLSGSSILQYAMSSTLYAARDAREAGYTRPLAMVDALTGVRMPNTYWLGRARKADVVLFSRAPLPAPAWTYGYGSGFSGDWGNWSWTETLCRDAEHDFLGIDGACSNQAARLTNAALHTTLHAFLPQLLAFLKDTLASNAEIMRGSVLLWHGSWYIEPLCASRGVPRAPKGKEVTLLHDIWSTSGGNSPNGDLERTPGDNDKPTLRIDPWSFYYNAQAYMHERILPKVLPHFNITYISLAVPAALRASNTLNSDGLLDVEPGQYSPLHPKDCIRSPWPGFGETLEGVFKRSLVVALRHAT